MHDGRWLVGFSARGRKLEACKTAVMRCDDGGERATEDDVLRQSDSASGVAVENTKRGGTL